MRGRPKNIIPEPAVGQVYGNGLKDRREVVGVSREAGNITHVRAAVDGGKKVITWTWHDWQKYAARAKLVTA